MSLELEKEITGVDDQETHSNASGKRRDVLDGLVVRCAGPVLESGRYDERADRNHEQ